MFLRGCGKEPDSAPVEKSNDAIPADDVFTFAWEVGEPTQSSAEIGNLRFEVDVSVFLEDSLNGAANSVRKAIESGVEVKLAVDQQRTALLFASFKDHTSVVKLLLDSGALVRSRDS